MKEPRGLKKFISMALVLLLGGTVAVSDAMQPEQQPMDPELGEKSTSWQEPTNRVKIRQHINEGKEARKNQELGQNSGVEQTLPEDKGNLVADLGEETIEIRPSKTKSEGQELDEEIKKPKPKPMSRVTLKIESGRRGAHYQIGFTKSDNPDNVQNWYTIGAGGTLKRGGLKLNTDYNIYIKGENDKIHGPIPVRTGSKMSDDKDGGLYVKVTLGNENMIGEDEKGVYINSSLEDRIINVELGTVEREIIEIDREGNRDPRRKEGLAKGSGRDPRPGEVQELPPGQGR